MTVLNLQTNVVFREAAARLERSSFFAAGNAAGKIAGVEGGKAAQIIMQKKSAQKIERI